MSLYPELDLKSENIQSDDKVTRRSKMMTCLAEYSTIWNILRIIFCVIATAWFLYNTIGILPESTDLPAFTICGNSIIFSEDLKDKYSTYAKEESELKKDDVKRSVLREEYLDRAISELTALEIFKMSINISSLVKECYFKPESIINNNISSPKINCENISQIIPSIYEGRKCFTFFSQLNTTEKENLEIQMKYEMNPVIHLEISSEDRNWPVGRIQNATIIVTIHNPNIIPTNLDMGFYRIYPKKVYDIRFNKHIAYFKPPPYKTNCRDYYKTNAKGERSRGDCIINCVKKETYGISDCANYYGIITDDLLSNDEKLCQNYKLNNSERLGNYINFTKARRKCLDDCQLSCIEENYEILYAEEYSNPYNNNSIVEITSHSMPYTFIHHKEELGRAEFIGTLGGHAHIWLGLSAVKLFNLFVHFIHHFNHILR